LLALAALIAGGCGGSRPRTLSAKQVLAALQDHGVQARISFPGGQGLLNLFPGSLRAEHVVAVVQASYPKLEVLVEDTVQHARERGHIPASGIPVRSSRSGKVSGRAFRVANVILVLHQMASVPSISAAVHDLAREARNR
jgi:hypothetical protein